MATQNSSVWMAVHVSERSSCRKNSDSDQIDMNGLSAIEDKDTSSSKVLAVTEDQARTRGRKECCSSVRQRLLTKRAWVKFLRERFPVLKWMPKYSGTNLYYDIIAGVTVGLMLVPQSLAYSSLAGLSPEYGLYSSYFGVLLYTLLGTSKDVSIGPVALLCILVEKHTEDHFDTVTFATTLALFSGLVLVIMAVFRLHFLISFISVPVLSGFTSAAAIKIAVTQIRGVLGLKFPRGSFFETVHYFFNHITEARAGDSVLSITCLVLLLGLRKCSQWNNKRVIPSDATWRTRILHKTIWFLCTARFTIVVFLSTVLAQVLVEHFKKRDIFILAGEMKGGVPKPTVPLKAVKERNNMTLTEADILKELSAGFLITPIIGFLETIAVAKTLARKNSYKLNVTQELLSLGIINIISSFFLSFPVAGSFSRSALNSQCGVTTPFGGAFTGIVVLLALSYLTSWFQYIPKATLSAMVIAAVIPLFEYKMIRTLWQTKKIDLVPMACAFVLCFYETEVGILGGVTVALAIFLYQHVQLRFSECPADGLPVIKIKSQYVYYPSGEQLISKIEKTARSKKGALTAIIVDFAEVSTIDSTTATLMKQLWLAMEHTISGPKLRFCNLNVDVETILSKTGIDTAKAIDIDVGDKNLCEPTCF